MRRVYALDPEQRANLRPGALAVRAHLGGERRRQPRREGAAERRPRAHAIEPVGDARQAATLPDRFHRQRREAIHVRRQCDVRHRERVAGEPRRTR